MQMLEQLVLSQGISTDKQSGLTCRALSECGCSGIHHPAEPVRKVAERVLVLVYKINPRLVRKQLPPDDDVTRRNLLYRQLFTEFDKLDLQRRKEMLEANKAAAAPCFDTFSPSAVAGATSSSPFQTNPYSPPPSSGDHHKSSTNKTVKYESRSRFGFSNGQQQKSAATDGGSPMKRILKSKSGHSITVTNDDESTSSEVMTTTEVPTKNCNGKQEYNEKLKKTIIAATDNHSRKSSNSDSVEDHERLEANNCPFCDWNYIGHSSQLDKHFWKACPILTKCPQCSQVLEVSALNLHLASKFCSIFFH